MLGRLEKFHTVLRGADTDEAPQCYKNIEEVLAFHSESIKILHTLHPLGVCMAGDEFDPGPWCTFSVRARSSDHE